MDITIRTATAADGEACGRVAYEGFRAVNERHGFPTNYPSVEAAARRVRALIDLLSQRARSDPGSRPDGR
jgi:hypothetical protein